MNFMGRSSGSSSSNQGFNGEEHNHNLNQIMNSSNTRGKLPFSSSTSSPSSSSSSSTSQPHKTVGPSTFHHHHHHPYHHQNQQQQQQQRGSWLGTNYRYEPHHQPSAEETTSTIGCYRGSGGAAHLVELMDSSPTAGNNGDDVRRRGGNDSFSDGDGAGGGGGLELAVGIGGSAGGGCVVVEREHMFDKVVTPSDVGKLNRLVIPKQHAEKYFPLDSSTNDKGLLLNFEDRNGKPWRFRYSYWNSSQSYVMTKGWSRFVKEKKLDAGDIVSFQRGLGDLGKDRLFIDWRRRPDAPELISPCLPSTALSHIPQHYLSSFHRSTAAAQYPWSTTSPLFFQQHHDHLYQQPQQRQHHPQVLSRDRSHYPQLNATNYSSGYGYTYSGGAAAGGGPCSYNNVLNPCSSSVIYLRSGAPQVVQAGMVQMQSGGVLGGGNGGNVVGWVDDDDQDQDQDHDQGEAAAAMPMVFESVPVVQGKAAAKRLRLFGVNMDCPISESDEGDILSSTTMMNMNMNVNVIPSQYASMAPHLSSSPIPPLQLRLYNGSPLPAMQLPLPRDNYLLHKDDSSSKSFDLDI